MSRPGPGPDVCDHGSLRRKCEICERDEEIADLKADLMTAIKEGSKRVCDLVRARAASTEARLTAAEGLLREAEDALSDWWNCMGDGTNKGPFPGLIGDTAALVPQLRAFLASALGQGQGKDQNPHPIPQSPKGETKSCILCGYCDSKPFRSCPLNSGAHRMEPAPPVTTSTPWCDTCGRPATHFDGLGNAFCLTCARDFTPPSTPKEP
jgi:hypothetical protein